MNKLEMQLESETAKLLAMADTQDENEKDITWIAEKITRKQALATRMLLLGIVIRIYCH